MAQVDNFLKIDIPGESKDSKHEGWFDLYHFDISLAQAGSMAWGGGGGTGQASFSPIPITTKVGKSSPELFLKCATGKHFPKAEIICRKAGEDPLEYMKIELFDVMVTSYRVGPGHGGEPPDENWTLDFSKISFAYQEQNKEGGGEGWITKFYDVKKNVKG